MQRSHWPSADDIVRRNSPVLVQIQRQEQAEYAGKIQFLLRLLGAVGTIGPVLYFTFHWFGR